MSEEGSLLSHFLEATSYVVANGLVWEERR